MNECVFCKIIDGEIPSNKVWEDEVALAFEDIHPKAAVHVLVVPKRHIGSLDQAEEEEETLGNLLKRVILTARNLGLSAGYKVVINVGDHGGQVVEHLHVHILGGEKIKGLV